MAGNETPPFRSGDPTEEKLLRRLRLISGVVILVMIVLLGITDTLGRLLIDPNFHASEVIFGILISTLIILLGIEGLSRLPGRGDR